MSDKDRPARSGGRPPSSLDLDRIKLKSETGGALDAALFDEIAQKVAKDIAEGSGKNSNKSTQLRRFYDEVVMWEDKARQHPERFADYLPLIRMLNAKAAYANGRQHVDQNFTNLMAHCLRQVESPETLRNFKLFFEAFMGFYKLERPRD